MPSAPKLSPILVKRYARSRVYDAEGQRYVSVEQLRSWAARGVAFIVVDIEIAYGGINASY
jgi:polyhydroxyalkanoate synthesis regulator protein